MEQDDSSLLVLLLETHPNMWSALGETTNDLDAWRFLQQLLAFLNAYQTMSEGNQIAILGMHSASCPLFYASPSLVSLTGMQPVHIAADGLVGSLKLLASQQHNNDTTPAPSAEPSVSAALTRALCFIQRVLHTTQGAGGSLVTREGGGGGVSASSAMTRGRVAGPQPRILSVRASSDAPSQYIGTMNAIFAAERQRIVLDTVMVGVDESALMQQGAYLTKGLYVKPESPAALLQHLLQWYVGDTYARSMLTPPTAAMVDFRAFCFCHKTPMDVGFVCSVCLSTYCRSVAECSTCGAVFDQAN